MDYISIQNNSIDKHNIILCGGNCEDGSDWRRSHAHVKERKICKWKQANSIQSTFWLLHEIGHIVENTLGTKYRRCESEFLATMWAIKECNNLGIKIPPKIIQSYQNYIDRSWDRGKVRGGNLPAMSNFRLKVRAK